MITIPDRAVHAADERSPGHYLASLGRRQWRTLALAAAVGVVWMASRAAVPAVLGNTLDAGVLARNPRHVLVGALTLAGAGLLTAGSGVVRHRLAVANWLQAALRTEQVVGHHAAHHGPAVAARTTTGEVVSVATSDAPRIGDLFDLVGRGSGAVVSGALVTVLLWRVEPVLGISVLTGMPLLVGVLALLINPLTGAQRAHRQVEGELTALGADTVAGLRVLKGIGGETQFSNRYGVRSQQVRLAGVRVAGVQSLLDAAHVLLPGVFVVALTWLAADAAIAGRLEPGQVVTVFGYAAFLRTVMETLTELLSKAVRSRIGAQRVLSVLARKVDPGPSEKAALPAAFAPLHDPASGLTVTPRLLTGLVTDDPDDAVALAERLARLPGAAGTEAPRLGGTSADRLDPAAYRDRVLVAEAEPRLFTGTVRTAVDPWARHTDAEVLAALETADALDVLDLDDEGLAAPVEERGRGLSGGQRQRLALARVVLRDPEVLVLVEPTSAVDAHTEDRIADRLAAARGGRTTLVMTGSPLVLERCDRVVRLGAARVAATGTHAELLARDPAYRALVVRDLEAQPEEGEGS
ncbi:ABC transporter transmembrane domain-containing protein [Spongisporangium articulatum]|uniref:ABC transporter transmembrane domain-containing protein n=1 Tax=Spongisporangium articulatum TaxID=3362603 RepID=A0ABW8AP95_9ACTN